MTTLIKLAWGNVFRSKRRTFITFASVSVGLALLIVIISLINGVDIQSKNNIIDSQTSHIALFQKGYFDKIDERPMNLLIKDVENIKKQLSQIPNVKAVESRICFAAGLIKGMDELPCKGIAVEPNTDPLLFNIKESITEGQWLEPGEANLVMGKDLANDIDVKVGDTVTIRMITSSQNEEFSWNAVDMTVKGLFDTGNPNVDSGTLILPLKQAQEGLSLGNTATEITVRINSKNMKDILSMQNTIKNTLNASSQQNQLNQENQEKQELEVKNWQDLAGNFMAISKAKTKNSSTIVMIILLIASMGIINTMLMAVMERTREIGMLTAMGMHKNEIIRLFLYESGIIGLLGSIVGCLLGGGIGLYLEKYGWSLEYLGDSLKKAASGSYPIKGVFYADVSLELLILTLCLGTGIAVIAGLYPAWKASRMDPVDALRHF